MTYLVDTHVWLWMLVEPERLGATTFEIVDRTEARLVLSAASAWEIAIKYALGRLKLPEQPDRYVPDRMRRTAVEALAVTHTHALGVVRLPAHHRDPFDRLLVAQAQLESLTILTADPAFAGYDVEVVDARS